MKIKTIIICFCILFASICFGFDNETFELQAKQERVKQRQIFTEIRYIQNKYEEKDEFPCMLSTCTLEYKAKGDPIDIAIFEQKRTIYLKSYLNQCQNIDAENSSPTLKLSNQKPEIKLTTIPSSYNPSSKYKAKPKYIPNSIKDYYVYITRTGKKYHASNCMHLRKSQKRIKKSEAIKQGYKPCKNCNP